jgi:hypothetical protein
MGQNNNILLIATMIVLVLSMGVMMNLSIVGYATINQTNNATCGNGVCEPGENCSTCARDCGTCPPVCGDNFCDTANTEDVSTCPQDCQTQDNTFLVFGVSAGGMMGAVFLVIYFFKMRPMQNEPKRAPEEEFIPGEDELIPYIRQMRSCGSNDAQIKDALVKKGWRTDIVDEEIKKHRK